MVTGLLRAGGRRVRGGIYAAEAAMLERRAPGLLVLAGDRPIIGRSAREWRDHGVRHLPLVVERFGATIGPLIEPGGQPCLECVERFIGSTPRTAADAAALELRGPATRLGDDSPLASLTAALAAIVVTAAVEQRAPAGVSLEVSWPWPRVVQRVWSTQPDCSCAGTGTRGIRPETAWVTIDP